IIVHIDGLLSRGLVRLQVLLKEREDFFPAVHRLLLPIRSPVIIEKAVTGAVIAVKLIVLAMLLELRLMLVHLFRRRRFVVVAEKADNRAGKIFGKINRSGRPLGCHLLLFHNDAAAPAFDYGVESFQFSGRKKPMTPSRACAENTDLLADVGLRT